MNTPIETQTRPDKRSRGAGVLSFAKAWLAALVVTVIVAVTFQTQNLIARLNGLDAGVSLGERLSMTGYDILHLGSLYGVFIAIALLVAMLAAIMVYRLTGFGRWIVFGAAGAVAMLVMLTLMKQAFFGVQMIAGARDGVGLAFQMLAGAIGGLVFAGVFRRRP